jgi:dTDP-glucose pyrophosphorylase
MTTFIKIIAENNRTFSYIFQKRQSLKSICFHNVIVDGLIITSVMNNRSCNIMKTYIETYPVGRYVIHEHGYYIRAGFD